MSKASTLKTAAISSVATFLVILTFLCVWLREPIYMIYMMRTEIPRKERRLLYHTDIQELAGELRRFAAEQRWNKPTRKMSPDFYYGDDPALPAVVRALNPSWIQINDERIDVGCGLIVREQSRSFGISVWRAGVTGSGTKKLEDGVWFYSEDGRVPSRFHIL